MGRKNNIEGQLSLFDMAFGDEESVEEVRGIVQGNVQEDMQDAKMDVAAKVQAASVTYKAGCFPECSSCWCATCEHSTIGGSVPRPFGDSTRPCPSCELCVRERKADICVIGSAEEGCKYRAEKEGLI